MASSFDDIIKAIKGLEAAIGQQNRGQEARDLSAEIKAEQDLAAAQADRIANAQKGLAAQKEKLKDLQKRIRNFKKLISN